MLEDGMLLLAIHVLKDSKVIGKANEVKKVSALDDIEVQEAFSEEDLKQLYELARKSDIDYSVAITVFESSTIKNQIDIMENYSCNTSIFIEQKLSK